VFNSIKLNKSTKYQVLNEELYYLIVDIKILKEDNSMEQIIMPVRAEA
jgi:hypothetical protein